jgi:hypothetical protein
MNPSCVTAAARKAARWLKFWYGTLWLLYEAARPARPGDFEAWEAELRSQRSTQ